MTGRLCSLSGLLLAACGTIAFAGPPPGSTQLARPAPRIQPSGNSAASHGAAVASPRVSVYPRDPSPQSASSYPRDRALAQAAVAEQGRGGEAPAKPAVAPRPAPRAQVFQSAEQLLNTVVEALESEASLTASLRQETSFFGRRLTGSGKYWQVRNASTLWRIEMTMREDQRQALFMQLSDSQTVWTYQRAADQQTLRKINLAQVNEFLKKESAVRAPETVGMLSWGLGGLPQLIAGINAAFAFGPPHQTEWKGQRVWRIEGGWRKETLVRLLPDQKDKILRGESANLSKLPEQIPNQVVVYIGAANLFPARIEYVRRDEPKAYEIWKSSRPHELTSIEFFDLQCGLPIDSRRFAWQAGNLDATDATETYLANLTPLADAMRDARRAIQGK